MVEAKLRPISWIKDEAKPSFFIEGVRLPLRHGTRLYPVLNLKLTKHDEKTQKRPKIDPENVQNIRSSVIGIDIMKEHVHSNCDLRAAHLF